MYVQFCNAIFLFLYPPAAFLHRPPARCIFTILTISVTFSANTKGSGGQLSPAPGDMLQNGIAVAFRSLRAIP